MRTLESRLERVEKIKARWQTHQKRFAKYRRAFLDQEGRCFYCGEMMCTGWRPADFKSGLRVTREHLFSRKQMAERLAHPRAVVAACSRCNGRRGDRPWQVFMLETVERVWGERPNARRVISGGGQIILLALVMGGSTYYGPIARDFCVEWRPSPSSSTERALERFLAGDTSLFQGKGEEPIVYLWVGHRITRPCLGDASGAF